MKRTVLMLLIALALTLFTGCAAPAEPSPATVETAGPAEVPEETTEAAEERNFSHEFWLWESDETAVRHLPEGFPEEYIRCLDLYYFALTQDVDYTFREAREISELIRKNHEFPVTPENVGYALMDLDGNGREELLIGRIPDEDIDEPYSLMAAYTILGNEPMAYNILTGADRSLYYLCVDGSVYHEGSSGVAYGEKFLYRVNGRALEMQEGLLTMGCITDEGAGERRLPYYRVYDESYDVTRAQEISQSEFESIWMDYRSRIVSPEYTKFTGYR